MKKTCGHCGKELPLSEFYRRKLKGGNYSYRSQCKECFKKNTQKNHKNRYEHTCEYCSKEFKSGDKDAKFCSRECMGKSYDKKIEVQCDNCGKFFEISLYKAENSNFHYCSNECRKQSTKHILSGLEHPRFDPNLTEEDREKHRDQRHAEWAYEVKLRDNFTCQCCKTIKSGSLISHHLNGYNWDKEHRYDVDNGVTLCESCHKHFHSIYGYGNNTKEQFKEFISK